MTEACCMQRRNKNSKDSESFDDVEAIPMTLDASNSNKVQRLKISKAIRYDIKKPASFTPFIIAMMIVVVYTIAHQFVIGHRSGMIAMNDFMGVWFLLFGVIKLFALGGFARTFGKYDLIAQHAKRYGYVFPFLEIILGAAYLIDYNMMYRIPINVFTALLMGITAVGVAHALHHKKDVLCVCMGIHFPLPMSKVTLIENVSMAAMAVGMLFWMTAVAGQSHTQDMNDSTPSEISAQCH